MNPPAACESPCAPCEGSCLPRAEGMEKKAADENEGGGGQRDGESGHRGPCLASPRWGRRRRAEEEPSQGRAATLTNMTRRDSSLDPHRQPPRRIKTVHGCSREGEGGAPPLAASRSPSTSGWSAARESTPASIWPQARRCGARRSARHGGRERGGAI
jgi:hypothetical protein